MAGLITLTASLLVVGFVGASEPTAQAPKKNVAPESIERSAWGGVATNGISPESVERMAWGGVATNGISPESVERMAWGGTGTNGLQPDAIETIGGR